MAVHPGEERTHAHARRSVGDRPATGHRAGAPAVWHGIVGMGMRCFCWLITDDRPTGDLPGGRRDSAGQLSAVGRRHRRTLKMAR